MNAQPDLIPSPLESAHSASPSTDSTKELAELAREIRHELQEINRRANVPPSFWKRYKAHLMIVAGLILLCVIDFPSEEISAAIVPDGTAVSFHRNTSTGGEGFIFKPALIPDNAQIGLFVWTMRLETRGVAIERTILAQRQEDANGVTRIAMGFSNSEPVRIYGKSKVSFEPYDGRLNLMYGSEEDILPRLDAVREGSIYYFSVAIGDQEIPLEQFVGKNKSGYIIVDGRPPIGVGRLKKNLQRAWSLIF